MSLQQKVAIVTGGNSGIGKAVAPGLARAGVRIVIDYIAHPEATDELEKQISALHDQAIGVDADASRPDDGTASRLGVRRRSAPVRMNR